MSSQKPSLLRVLSDSWRIISSNSLHFLALSSLFFFPNIVYNIIHSLTWPHPSTPLSNYAQLLSPQNSEVPSMDKSRFTSLLLYSLPFFLLNLCIVISTTNSIFHGFHNKPLKLSSSIKSIASSFFPLLATKIAYLVIMAVILFGFGLLMGFLFFGLMLLGYSIEANSAGLMVVVFVMVVVFLVGCTFLYVELILMDASAVMESKWGFSAIKRSSSLVKGAKGVAWWIITLFWVLNALLSALFFILPSRSGAVVGMVVIGAVSTLLSVLSLASNTVLFVYCKAVNGEAELPTTDRKLQGPVYIQLPRDAELDRF